MLRTIVGLADRELDIQQGGAIVSATIAADPARLHAGERMTLDPAAARKAGEALIEAAERAEDYTATTGIAAADARAVAS